MAERLTLTIPEAAELLGVSRGVAYEAARVGELPTLRLGRRLLVPRARLEALLGQDLPEGRTPATTGVQTTTAETQGGFNGNST